MKISRIILTLTYWLSDLALAIWLGGTVVIALLFRVPVEEGAGMTPADLSTVATLASRVAELHRPTIVGACILLVASIVITVALERDDQGLGAGWWVLWIARSIAVVSLVIVLIYASGDLGAPYRVLTEAAEATLVETQTAFADTLGASLDTTAVAVAPSRASQASELVRPAFEEYHYRYNRWMGIEVALGAFVFLTGAIEQATWRRRRRIPPAPTKPPEEAPTAEKTVSAPPPESPEA